ncbi:MAG: efflux RND transporter periplasmic adaptor subunit, partial [Salaquimonas sp.]
MLQKNDHYQADDENSDRALTASPKGTILSVLAKGAAQIALMALVLGAALLVTMRLVNTKPEIEKRPIFPAVYTVETLIAKPENHQPILTLYGEVVAGRSVELRSLVSGEITSISPKLRSGGTVKAGEMLLQIDKFNYEGQLREAKANAAETVGRLDEANARVRLEQSRLQSAIEQLEFAKSDLERIQQLRTRGTATQKQVEDRQLLLSQRTQVVEQSEINIIAEKAKISQLKASADRLQWKIEQSERDVQNTELTAPFDATIRSSSAEIGKLTTANDVLVSMYQVDSLEARFVLTDERFGRLQSDGDGVVGRKIEIIWNVGGIDYTYSGVIDRIGAEIASARGGVEVFALVEGADHSVELRPGAFVEIRLPDRIYTASFRLPDSSIYHSDTVYLVENGELVERTVNISAYDGDTVLVGDGLENGNEILTTRISEISAGLKVRKEGDPEHH